MPQKWNMFDTNSSIESICIVFRQWYRVHSLEQCVGDTNCAAISPPPPSSHMATHFCLSCSSATLHRHSLLQTVKIIAVVASLHFLHGVAWLISIQQCIYIAQRIDVAQRQLAADAALCSMPTNICCSDRYIMPREIYRIISNVLYHPMNMVLSSPTHKWRLFYFQLRNS